MKTIQVFDPAMCCGTGVCGPSVDPVLARFTADLEWLKGRGFEVERYNLASEPGAFAGNATVKAALQAEGTGCLPLILCDGAVVSKGLYPTRGTLAHRVGASTPSLQVSPASAACCPPSPKGSPGTGCC